MKEKMENQIKYLLFIETGWHQYEKKHSLFGKVDSIPNEMFTEREKLKII